MNKKEKKVSSLQSIHPILSLCVVERRKKKGKKIHWIRLEFDRPKTNRDQPRVTSLLPPLLLSSVSWYYGHIHQFSFPLHPSLFLSVSLSSFLFLFHTMIPISYIFFNKYWEPLSVHMTWFKSFYWLVTGFFFKDFPSSFPLKFFPSLLHFSFLHPNCQHFLLLSISCLQLWLNTYFTCNRHSFSCLLKHHLSNFFTSREKVRFSTSWGGGDDDDDFKSDGNLVKTVHPLIFPPFLSTHDSQDFVFSNVSFPV